MDGERTALEGTGSKNVRTRVMGTEPAEDLAEVTSFASSAAAQVKGETLNAVENDKI
jgi:hypothetical protein